MIYTRPLLPLWQRGTKGDFHQPYILKEGGMRCLISSSVYSSQAGSVPVLASPPSPLCKEESKT